MSLDFFSIVSTNIDIDSQDTAFAAEQLQHRGIKNDGPSVCHTRLDNALGLNGPNQLLQGQDVLGKLNDRPSHPGEVIRIFVGSRFQHPLQRKPGESSVSTLTLDIVKLVGF